MLQNTSKTLGFQKIMVYKTPPGGGGKSYLARGLMHLQYVSTTRPWQNLTCQVENVNQSVIRGMDNFL